jgi:TATA-box binding protein (TBP) (component of TFIID and TFIIIB)
MFDISRNYGSNGVPSNIANVTTNHILRRRTRYATAPLDLNLDEVIDRYRSVFGFSPPRSMPAVKLNIQCVPYFKKMNVALYASGSVVQTGCQSPEQARLAAHLFARTLGRVLGIDIVVTEFRVDNIVATVNTAATSVNLDAVKQRLGARCSYKSGNAAKNNYSAAIIRSRINPRTAANPGGENIKILMYNTAHAVMMGVTSRDSIAQVIDEIDGIVQNANRMDLVTTAPLAPQVLQQQSIRRANAAIQLRLGPG